MLVVERETRFRQESLFSLFYFCKKKNFSFPIFLPLVSIYTDELIWAPSQTAGGCAYIPDFVDIYKAKFQLIVGEPEKQMIRPKNSFQTLNISFQFCQISDHRVIKYLKVFCRISCGTNSKKFQRLKRNLLLNSKVKANY